LPVAKPLIMKQFNYSRLSVRLTILTIIFTSLVINSCRKDSKSPQPTITDPAISEAKAWYENNYLANTNILATRGTGSATNRLLITRPAVSQQFDFSQNIQPDWKNAASYTRLKKNVVEIPIAPGSHFGWAIKNGTTGAITNKKYTRTSFLLFNDGKRYGACVMMVVADSAYVGGNMGKLDHNTYRKHDADFSGMVIYFTPKGQYIGKYIYRNGQLATSSANKAASASTASAVKTRTANLVRDDVNCYDVYVESFDDDGAVTEDYVGTTCDDGSGTLDDGGGFPPPPIPGFGLNGQNVIIPETNFTNFLSYLQQQGYNCTYPYPSSFTYNGQTYTGMATDITDAYGNVVDTYFTPNSSSSNFQVGYEYAIGVGQAGGPNSTVDVIVETALGEIDFGSPDDYLGSGAVITGATLGPGGSGGANTSISDTYDGNDSEPSDDNSSINPGPLAHIPSQITLNNGQIVTVIFGTTSDQLSADQPVSIYLIKLLIQGLNIASQHGITINSIYIKATTNGQHTGSNSNHFKQIALDISRINGIPMIVSGASNEVVQLQLAFDQSTNIRENFGPYFLHKFGQPYPSAPAHNDHIHISVTPP
jgi:hypothetical protein